MKVKNTDPLNGNEELIETLWNVNFFIKSVLNLGRIGINRNIVECK